jgi:hypothetical protein
VKEFRKPSPTPLTDAELSEYEEYADAGFPKPRPMTDAESEAHYKTAREIYKGREAFPMIEDHKKRRIVQALLKDAEDALAYEMSVTHGLPEFEWPDGLRIELGYAEILNRTQTPPMIKVFYKTASDQ